MEPILVALHHKANRRLLEAYMKSYYPLFIPDRLSEETFLEEKSSLALLMDQFYKPGEWL